MRAGYVCIEPLEAEIYGEKMKFERGDLAPSHIVAQLPRATRERHFARNEKLTGDVHA